MMRRGMGRIDLTKKNNASKFDKTVFQALKKHSGDALEVLKLMTMGGSIRKSQNNTGLKHS